MPRYIDVENYCKTICRCNGEACDKSKCPIWNAPTVDVEPVRHGRWGACKIVGYDGLHAVYATPCSECGEYTHEYYKPFCPNCGAKMDGEAI